MNYNDFYIKVCIGMLCENDNVLIVNNEIKYI